MLYMPSDSMSVRDRKTGSQQKMAKIIVDELPMAESNETVSNCNELSKMLLAKLISGAYNPRYMSINWPIAADNPHNPDADDRAAYKLIKRRVENIPSFYVSETHAVQLSEKPAWEVSAIELDTQSTVSESRRKKRSTISLDNDDEPTSSEKPHTRPNDVNSVEMNDMESAINETVADIIRNKRGHELWSRRKNQIPTTWKCEATIDWVDLGPDYFPRYLRTIKCTKHLCYYDQFRCKAKSFAVKILHRAKGMCVDAGNLRKVADFKSEYSELWRWEEVAINFCCECGAA